MTRRAKDEEREERIHMGIIVNAYSPEEQVTGWSISLISEATLSLQGNNEI